MKLHPTKSRVFTILAISLVGICLLTMAITSQQALGAALDAATSITQCKPATAETITLCWITPTVGGNPKIKSWMITNSTEVCTGNADTFECEFGGYNAALNAVASPGTNATGGTGSGITVANFTGLTAGQLFKFIIYANNAHGNGTASAAFQAGTLPGEVDWSERPAQTFGNGTNFGDSTQFAADQDFANFQNFGEDQVFGAGSGFAQDQTFNGSQNFTAASIKFDSGTQFDTVQTFGDGANFTGDATFVGTNTFGSSVVFGEGSNFPSSQAFGSGANFSGKAVFGALQGFAPKAIFAAGQEFTAGSTYSFDDFTTFNAGTDFGAARIFDTGTMFDSTMTFYEDSTFAEATMFGANQEFTASMTFGEDMHFGADTDFSSLEQAFKAGTSFGAGTQFKVGQPLPIDTIPSFGLMLEAFTCADATCQPDVASAGSTYLPPGGILPFGTDPVPISSSISSEDPSISIPGLGFTMNFTTVDSNGKTSVDPIDPAQLPGSGEAITGGASAGSRSVAIGVNSFDTVGTALDIDLGSAGASGDMTITLPYVEADIPGSVAEGDLSVLHYVSGEWETVDNCTVSAADDNITCTGITTLSPFSVGASASASATGGTSCDSNGFGGGKSLALYEINWDILEANEVEVIAGSTCGAIDMRVFTQQTIVSGGLAPVQPYLADNKVVLRAPLIMSGSDSFRITLENNWNAFEQTIYPELQGSSGTILLNFQEAQYSKVKLFVDEEPQQAAVPSSEVFMDSEPQAIMDSEPQAIMDLEPQLTTEQKPISSPECGEGTILMEGVCEVQEEQMGFWDWLFSLFS